MGGFHSLRPPLAGIVRFSLDLFVAFTVLLIEPSMSSSHCLWVPNLQPLSLRSPTPHRPLHISSPPWILLRIHFCRYHWDRLAPIYMLVEDLQPSETARANSLLHALTRSKSALADVSLKWRHHCHVICSHHRPLICWRHPPHQLTSSLTIPLTRVDQTVNFDRRLTLTIDFSLGLTFCSPGAPYPVFRIDFIFAVHFLHFLSSSCCNNLRQQSNKRFCNFCKRFGHNIETCYHRNKSAVSIFAATVANIESVQPMASLHSLSLHDPFSPFPEMTL